MTQKRQTNYWKRMRIKDMILSFPANLPCNKWMPGRANKLSDRSGQRYPAIHYLYSLAHPFNIYYTVNWQEKTKSCILFSNCNVYLFCIYTMSFLILNFMFVFIFILFSFLFYFVFIFYIYLINFTIFSFNFLLLF